MTRPASSPARSAEILEFPSPCRVTIKRRRHDWRRFAVIARPFITPLLCFTAGVLAALLIGGRP